MNIKMIFFFIVFVFFVFILGIKTYAEEETFDITILNESNSTYQGSANYLYVNLQPSSIPLAAMDFVIYYDDTQFSIINAYAPNPSVYNGGNYSINYEVSGEIRFSFASPDGANAGYLLFIYYSVSENANVGQHQFLFGVGEAYDANLNPVSVYANDFKFNVMEKIVLPADIYVYAGASQYDATLDDQVTFDFYSSSLYQLAAGEFEFFYDDDNFEFVSLTLDTSLLNDTPIYTINSTQLGYINLSYINLEGIDYAHHLFTLQLKVKANVSESTSILLKASSLYDESLAPLKMNESRINIFLYETITTNEVEIPDMYLVQNGNDIDDPFSVDICIDENSGLAAGDFVLYYDNNDFNVLSVDIDESVVTNGGIIVDNPNNNEGQIRFSYVNVNGLYEAQVLLHITFEAKNKEQTLSSSMHLTSGTLVDENYNDISMDKLPFSAILERYYTINFYGYNDLILHSERIKSNEIIHAPSIPYVLGYVTTGWDTSFHLSQEDMDIHAIYVSDISLIFEDLSVTYDHEMHFIILDGLPENATVEYNYTDGYRDVGTYELNATISMDDQMDYVMTAYLTITKAALIIHVDDVSSVYLDELKPLTYTLTGINYQDEVDIVLTKESGTFPGEYVISASAAHDNYDITIVNGIYEITKIPVDMTGFIIAPQSFVYDGQSHHLDIDVSLPTGVETYRVLNNELINAGSIDVIIQFDVSFGYEELPDMFVNLSVTKASTTFDINEFHYEIFDDYVTIDYLNQSNRIEYSFDQEAFINHTVIQNLDPATDYQIYVRLAEIENYQASDSHLIHFTTYNDAALYLQEALEYEILDVSSYEYMEALFQSLDTFKESDEKTALIHRLNELIDEYNLYVTNLNQEFSQSVQHITRVMIASIHLLPFTMVGLCILTRRKKT